ncbi:hypothetical protein [Pseudoalteromonas maricaloris]|uniref:hypothetical protein n=1 Tax=Pseudoalteromonas maricaloris TaxID=184924 RepID=UPI003C1CE7F9
MNTGFSNEFVEQVMSEITPFQHLSGTEHVAPLLYSMIRMLRPETVVEFGTGYTTPYILLALKHNEEDFKQHQRILKKKAVKHYSKLSDAQRGTMEIESWWQTEVTQDVYGSEPILPVPEYYLKPYRPHLFSFEVLPAEDPYVEKLANLVSKMGLGKNFTLNTGARVKDYIDLIPKDRLPIDFAWNDFGNKYRFWQETYKSVNSDGGVLAFHNTTNSETDFKEDLDKVQEAIKPLLQEQQCELMTFLEPHKFTQRSLTVLRKLDGFKEAYFEDARADFDRDLIKLSRLSSTQFP